MIPVHDPSEIPEFQSMEEEAEFWDTHQVTEALLDALPGPGPDEEELPPPRQDRHPFQPAMGGTCLVCTNLGRTGFRDDPIHGPRDPLVDILVQLYELGAQPHLHYTPLPEAVGGDPNEPEPTWCCHDELNLDHHQHGNTPDEAARGLLEILKVRRQAEDEGVFS